jgi:hypothetical protein
VPGYISEHNPVDGIWNYLKWVELGNVCCPHLAALRLPLRRT